MTGESAAQFDREALRRTSRRSWRRAMVLAIVGLACAVLLGGLSAWFLGAVAVAGLSAAALTFNFHAPGALVRLFAIGRTLARYGERLTGHHAALTDLVVRRAQLFGAMARASSARQASWQLGDQARLTEYLDDVDDLDYGRLRADLPAITMAVGLCAGLAATLMVAPLALVAIVSLLVACVIVGSRAVGVAAAILEAGRACGRNSAEIAGAAAAAVVSLRAEGAWQASFAPALHALAQADGLRLRLRRLQANVDALCSAIGPVAGASVIAAAWFSGARGEALLVPVFVAFAWLALAEALQGTSRMIVASQRRVIAGREIARWTAPPLPESAPERRVPLSLARAGLPRCAPDGRSLGSFVDLDLRRGRPTILIGASGSGKTSLLKQIAGWIGDDNLAADDGAMFGARDRRAIAMVCLHDAAILADTVRANLFAPDATDVDLWAALAAVEMDERIRRGGGLDAWIAQETLSLGEAQRLNLARACLTDQPLVLLDEPAEHVDEVQAKRILGRLFSRLADRVVVVSSHHPVVVPDARTLAL